MVESRFTIWNLVLQDYLSNGDLNAWLLGVQDIVIRKKQSFTTCNR